MPYGFNVLFHSSTTNNKPVLLLVHFKLSSVTHFWVWRIPAVQLTNRKKRIQSSSTSPWQQLSSHLLCWRWTPPCTCADQWSHTLRTLTAVAQSNQMMYLPKMTFQDETPAKDHDFTVLPFLLFVNRTLNLKHFHTYIVLQAEGNYHLCHLLFVVTESFIQLAILSVPGNIRQLRISLVRAEHVSVRISGFHFLISCSLFQEIIKCYLKVQVCNPTT